MRIRKNQLLAAGLVIFLAFNLNSQCDTGSEPECQCETAEILCSINELDGYTFSMSSFQHPGDGPSPLCNGDGVPNNPTWFAFIAWCDELELTVSISNCSTVSGIFGTQVVVYEDCNSFNEVDCSVEDCNNQDDKVLDLEGLTIGQVYYFLIDGCLGSACDVEISVDGMCTEEIEDWTNDEITGDTEVCQGDQIDYMVDDLDGATSYHWYIDGTETDVTDDPDNSITWNSEGSFQLCVDVSNECVPESDDPEQICETINVYDPDAGMIMATPNPLCPGETSDVEVTGYNDGADYEQVLIIVDENDEVLDIIVGGSTASVSIDECGTVTVYSLNYPVGDPVSLPSVGSSYSGSDCMDNCCDEVSEDIIFEDDEEPVFDMEPADITFDCYADVPPPMDLMVTDNCSPDAMVMVMETDDSDMCDGGTITREWEFEDDCGNMVMHTQTITIEGIEEAEFINPPSDMVLDCDEMIPPAIDLDYSNGGTGSCLIEGFVTPVVNGAFDICGTIITYEWDFTDLCGRNINHVQTIEILPAEEAEFINPPSDLELSCNDPIPPLLDLDYSNGGSGACLLEGSVTPTTNGNFDACGSIIENTWEYTDPCNNTIEHVQVIEILPAEEAEFINPPADITIDCSDFLSFTIEDLEYNNGEAGACEISGMVSPIVNDETDDCGGNIDLQYVFTDDCGREIEHIQSITINPPDMADFLNLPADMTVDCNNIPPMASALDYSNGETGICLIEGSVDPVIDDDTDECGGTIVNTWEFEDDCGRTITHEQIITIDPAPEAMFLSTPPDLTLDCDEFNDFTPETLDYSNGETGFCLIEGEIDPEPQGNITPCGGSIDYIWEFEDNCGRVILHIQEVTVLPAPEAAFVNIPSDITIDCEDPNDDLPFLEYDNEADGVCEIQGFVEGVPNGSINECGGMVEMVWSFTDDCGRNITASQMIEYLPAPEPEFDDPPEDITIDCDEDLPDADPLYFENGEDSPCEISGEVDPIVDFDDNIFTYTWTFTNECTGNTIEHIQTIEQLLPVEFDEDEYEFELCIGNSFDLSDIEPFDINNTDPEITYHDDLPADSGNEIDPELILEEEFVEFYIVGTNEYGCFDVATVYLIAEERLVAGEDIEEEFCISNTLLDLFSFLEPPASLEGEFTQTDGPVELDFSFGDEVDISEAEAGIYVFEYYIESPNSCPDDMSEMIIELLGQPTIDLISIECTAAGDSYEVIVTNNNYEFDISDGDITSQTDDEVVISNIPIGTTLEIEIEVSSSNCSNSYSFNSPDCDCPTVGSPVSEGNQAICEGETVPALSVTPGMDVVINWYDAPMGGNLLLENSSSYTPTVMTPGVYNFYAEAESTIQEGCFAPFRVAIQLTIYNVPESIDTFINVCDINQNGFYSFEKVILDNLVRPDSLNYVFSYYTSIDDLNNGVNSLVFPFQNTIANEQLIYVSVEGSGSCQTISTIELNVNSLPEITPSATDETCLGLEDGSIAYTINSSSENNTILLNNTAVFDNPILGLSSGNYSIIIQDSLMCSDTAMIDIESGLEFELASYSSTCFDNDTPSDATDDYYEINFVIDNNLGTQQTFILSFNSLSDEYTTGDNVNLVIPAINMVVDFVVTDLDGNCTLEFDTGLLNPCSTDCLIVENAFNFVCNNNGTDSQPDDDFYDFTINLDAINPGASGSFDVYVNSINSFTFNYNTDSNFQVNVSESPVSITIQDSDISSCSYAFTEIELNSCSESCELFLEEISYLCSDNQTIQNSDDDFYTYSFVITGMNVSDSFNLSGLDVNYAYGDTITIDSLFIADGIQIYTVTDPVNPNCSLNINLDRLESCSDPCSIEVVNLNIGTCDDNNTANNSDDDTYEISFEVNPIEGNTSSFSMDDSNGNSYGPFNYNELIVLTGISAQDDALEFMIQDENQSNCLTSFDVSVPSCSDACDITAIITLLECDDNGTLMTNADDLFNVSILVESTGGGSGFTTDNGDSGNYGDLIMISNQNISDGVIDLLISDTQYSDCSQAISIMPPPACSEPCTIEFAEFQILDCDDAGTPTDPDDDVYSVQFNINVLDGMTGQIIVTDDEGNQYGPFDYNTTNEIGPFVADGSETNLSFTDTVNSSCGLDTLIQQNSCSDLCIIDIELIDVICNDNGTAESNDDDIYSIEFSVTGVNNATDFTIQNNGNTGQYGEVIRIDNLLISDGVFDLNIQDNLDAGCSASIEVTPPEPCSSPCEVTILDFEIGECDDNGTGDTGDDDFFEITLSIENVEGGGTSYSLSDGTTTYGPFEYGLSNTIGPFIANGQTITLQLSDTSNPVCALDIDFSLESCSDCSATVNINPEATVLSCFQNTIGITAIADAPVLSINWTGPSMFTSDQNDIMISEAGTYRVDVVFEDGCMDSDEVLIDENFSTPEVVTPDDAVLNCEVNSVTLSGELSTLTTDTEIQWLDADGNLVSNELNYEVTSPGMYMLALFDMVSGCQSIGEFVTVTEEDNIPDIVIYAEPTNIFDCEISTIELSTDPQANTLYTWIIENEVISNDLNITVSNPSLVNLIALDTISLCTNEELVDLQDFTEYPIINLSGVEDFNCDIDPVCIDLETVTLGQNLEINWYNEQGELVNNNNQFCTTEVGDYTIEVTDLDNSCTNSEFFSIEAPIIPELQLPGSIELSIDDNYQFNPLINLTLDEIESLIWDTNATLDCYDCLNPTLQSFQNGDVVTLTVISASGCEVTASTEIRTSVIVGPSVYIPNVFAPATTGNFTIYASEGIPIIDKLYIFDRWGELVFFRENFVPNQQSEGWDGYFNDGKSEQGVYVYLFEFEINGRKEYRYGDVALLW